MNTCALVQSLAIFPENIGNFKKKKKKKKFKAFAWLQSQDIVIHMEFLHFYFSKFTNALMDWSPD